LLGSGKEAMVRRRPGGAKAIAPEL